MSDTARPVYHVLYIFRDEDGARLCSLSIDTLEGVYANMTKRGMTPSGVKVIHGTKVALDPERFNQHYEEVRRRLDAEGKAARRQMYEVLKKEFEEEGS